LFDFVEFRELERNRRNRSKYIEILEEFSAGMSIDEVVSLVKKSGILINLYPGNDPFAKLRNDVDLFMKRRFCIDGEDSWSKTLHEIEVIYLLKSTFYGSKRYIDLNKLESKYELLFFILNIELTLRNLISKLTKNSNNELPISIEIEISNYDFENAFYEVQVLNDLIINNSSEVLKYLLFYKKVPTPCTSGLFLDLSTEKLIAYGSHSLMYNYFNILRQLVEKWKFYDVRVSNIGDNFDEIHNKESLRIGLSNDISVSRFNNRMAQMANDSTLIDFKIEENQKEIDFKKSYISSQEALAVNTYTNYFFSDNLDHLVNEVPVKVWIRAYSVLLLVSRKHLDNPKTSEIHKLVIKFSKNDLVNELVDKGVGKDYILTVIDHLTFKESSRDILDSPLIQYGEDYILVPSTFVNADIGRLILSSFEVKKKGDNFEKVVRDSLISVGIDARKVVRKGSILGSDTREFDSDCMFILGRDVVMIECKANKQPSCTREFYEYNKKRNDTIDQFKVITDFYENNYHHIRDEFLLAKGWRPRNIIKIILNTVYTGLDFSKSGFYFTDYSQFKAFIERKPPSISFTYKKKRYQYMIRNFSYFSGNLTSSKLVSFLKNQHLVWLQKKNSQLVNVDIEMEEKTLRTSTWDRIVHSGYRDVDKPLQLDKIKNLYNIKE